MRLLPAEMGVHATIVGSIGHKAAHRLLCAMMQQDDTASVSWKLMLPECLHAVLKLVAITAFQGNRCISHTWALTYGLKRFKCNNADKWAVGMHMIDPTCEFT